MALHFTLMLNCELNCLNGTIRYILLDTIELRVRTIEDSFQAYREQKVCTLYCISNCSEAE